MVRVGKYQGRIIFSPLKYILDGKGNIKYFNSYLEAEKYLLDNGYSEDDLDDFLYESDLETDFSKITVCENCGKVIVNEDGITIDSEFIVCDSCEVTICGDCISDWNECPICGKELIFKENF